MTTLHLLAGIVAALSAPAADPRISQEPPTVQAPALPSPETAVLTIGSEALEEDRKVFVALPKSHARSARPYPVIVVLDGEANFAPAALIAATLARLGHIPEAIVVGVPNSGGFETRVRDLTPPGLSVSGSSLNEGGDRFLDFIQNEVKPAVAERFRGSGPMILVGHSSGGVIATWAASTRPEAFPVVVAIDAPAHLQDGWLERRLIARASSSDPRPLRYVTLESRFGWRDSAWAGLQASAPASWRLRRLKLEGESHEGMVFSALYQGLRLAFDDYSAFAAPQPPRASASEAFDHYRRIETQFDAVLPPPERLLGAMVFDLLTEGRVAEAKTARDWLLLGYGTDQTSPFGDLGAMIAEADRLPPLPETVPDLLATPFATVEEIRPYVGEWVGTVWANPEAMTPQTLSIRIVEDRVVAELTTGSGEARTVETLQYLRVTADGLAFGRMNGMRPRAMIIGEGRRSGERLEGQSRMRGIRLPLPNGDSPRTFQFRFERRS